MRRLRSKLGAGAILAVGMTFGLSAAADTKIEWNHSIWGNPRAWTKGIETIAEYVKENSGGNFTIRLHYGETLSPARQALDGISIGAFEQAAMCTSYHPGKNPIGNVLDLPFLPLGDPDVQSVVYDDFNTKFEPWIEEIGRWNAVPYWAAILPQYEFMGRGNPPKTMEDWRGMRVRALGGLGEAMRKLGAVPTTVPAPETYTAVERGVVQAASWPFTYAHAAFRLNEISSWYTINMAPGVVFCPTINHKPSHEALPDEYRKLLEEAKAHANVALRAAYNEADEKNLPMFRQTMTEVSYTDDELAQFRTVAGQPVWDDWVKETEDKGLPGQAALDFVIEAAERAEAAKGS